MRLLSPRQKANDLGELIKLDKEKEFDKDS